jgi:methionyl-tRNA formyltransferase
LSTLKNGFIDWNLDPIELDRFICAFDDPYEGASTFINGELVHLKSVMLCSQDSNFHSFQVGLIYRKRESWICIALKGMSLIVKDITDASGSSVMSRIEVGDRMYTPVKYLHESMTRVRYTSEGLLD